ncbi:MAG TPA: hypothetical protein VGG39_08705 [Polyangiaceae bacterium]
MRNAYFEMMLACTAARKPNGTERTWEEHEARADALFDRALVELGIATHDEQERHAEAVRRPRRATVIDFASAAKRIAGRRRLDQRGGL